MESVSPLGDFWGVLATTFDSVEVGRSFSAVSSSQHWEESLICLRVQNSTLSLLYPRRSLWQGARCAYSSAAWLYLCSELESNGRYSRTALTFYFRTFSRLSISKTPDKIHARVKASTFCRI